MFKTKFPSTGGRLVIIILLILALIAIGVGFSLRGGSKSKNQFLPTKPMTATSTLATTTSTGLGFSGQRLAGTNSPLLEFNETDYRQVLASDKLVVLYFYANWCPLCRVEFPKMIVAFNGLVSEEVVGFRVNYRDSDTNASEEALARQFGITYQHTKILLRHGQVVLKSLESWDENRYLKEINQALASLAQ